MEHTQPRGILCFSVWFAFLPQLPLPGLGRVLQGWFWMADAAGDPCELLKAQMENKHRPIP